MKTSNYNIRLDPAVKAKAEETYAGFGLNLSEAINVFLHMSIKWEGFPFEVRNPKHKSETISAMLETELILEEYNEGKRTPKHFNDARALFVAMDDDDQNEEGDG
ncbi:MAG: type II toxin-antitoxin system RelB/DinJ family antitoxin [Defluviitaleaceae bacterium]|nr:type II toxin-antitoxin system RelB/DinJ family antitoxin [Defluviitaleaceae bacterium]